MTYNSYDFKLTIEDGPEFNPAGVASGEAYSEITVMANGFEVMGTSTTGDSVGYNNATILYLSFNIPEGVAPGNYKVGFDGDVEAHDRNMDTFDIEEVDGQIRILDSSVAIDAQEYQFDVEGLSKFYFSHDNRTFIDDGLLKTDLIAEGTLKSRPVLSNGDVSDDDWTIADLDKITFAIANEGWESPQAVYQNVIAPTLTGDDGKLTYEEGIAFFKEKIPFTISTTFERYNTETKEVEEVELNNVSTLYNGDPIVTGEAYIGVKGDTDLNGTVNSVDATLMLVYAAEYGSGNSPKIRTVESDKINALSEADLAVLEDFVYFLSDVSSESEDHGVTSNRVSGERGTIDAADATYDLDYAARFGAGNTPDWYDVLDEDPLPKYTKIIGEGNGKTGKN